MKEWDLKKLVEALMASEADIIRGGNPKRDSRKGIRISEMPLNPEMQKREICKLCDDVDEVKRMALEYLNLKIEITEGDFRKPYLELKKRIVSGDYDFNFLKCSDS